MRKEASDHTERGPNAGPPHAQHPDAIDGVEEVLTATKPSVMCRVERVGPADEVLGDRHRPEGEGPAASPARSTALGQGSDAMRRRPSLAVATSAAPMTSTPSRRRRRVSSGISTCVVAQGRQIEAAGTAARTAPKGAPPARRRAPRAGALFRVRAANTAADQVVSTAASSVPTMSTAELRLRQEEPSS